MRRALGWLASLSVQRTIRVTHDIVCGFVLFAQDAAGGGLISVCERARARDRGMRSCLSIGSTFSSQVVKMRSRLSALLILCLCLKLGCSEHGICSDVAWN